METISVVTIVGEEQEYIECCVRSALRIADEVILVLDSKSRDGTKEIITSLMLMDERIKVYMRIWTQGSDQKHFAMKQATKDWILFLDGDEVLSDEAPTLIRKALENNTEEFDSFKLRGHHFSPQGISWEDASVPEHYWEGRFIKNTPDLFFERGKQHALLQGYKKVGTISETVVLHYGYCKNLQRIMDRFNENMFGPSKLQIHNPDFLMQWKNSHILGTYPWKPCSIDIHPRIIREKFGV